MLYYSESLDNTRLRLLKWVKIGKNHVENKT